MLYFSNNHKNNFIITLLILVLIITFCRIARAEEEKSDFIYTKVPPATLFLNRQRSNIGNSFRYLTKKIDDFFFKNKTYDNPQRERDRLMLRLDFFKEEHQTPVFVQRVSVRIYFPRVSIVVDNNRIDNLPNRDLTNKDTKIGTGLDFDLREIKKFMLFFGIGITVRSKNSAVYSRFHLMKHDIKIKNWKARLRQSVFWYSDNGFGELTQVDFDYKISEKMLLSLVTAGLNSHISKGFEFEESLILNYDLIKGKKTILLRVSEFAHTKPFYNIDKYRTDIVFRVQLINPWMHFDVAPQLEFPSEDNFKGVPGIKIGLDTIF